ncbi:hypothetical protein HID58_043044 [Brassica napus]|uniref:Formin-like protein n=1 Tax=Brassica napus TaxID=3708 RepID=A0ABQ8BFE3_BRANA|nr:formin-like protein 7 [Brassica napus]KAH0903541.1 hypothetical protein HID58_043044 [Brassica napus]
MSFLFRKNGSSSRRRIKDKLRGRNSDRGKRGEEEERDRYDSLPAPPSPWGFLFPEDFERIDGNLKAVIEDEEGLDVIYWKKLLELENSGKTPKPRRGGKSDGDGEEEEGFYRGSGTNPKGDAFSFHVKKSQSPLSSGGEVGDQSNNTSVDGGRYSYTSSSTGGFSDYGKQSQSKFQAPGGRRYPSLPLPPGQLGVVTASSSTMPPPLTVNHGSFSSSPSIQTGGGGGSGLSPAIPLPPGQFPPAIGFSSISPLPLTVNQTVPPPPPGKKAPGPPPPPPVSKTGPPKPPGNGKGPTKAAEGSSAISKDDPAQPKLKPLHWDKVNPDASHSMVWHRIDGGSFNFDGDLMEALFGYVGARKPSEANSVPQKPTVSTTQTYILDPRKSQNKAIVLKSLGMTKEEIIDLLTQGHDADTDTLEKLSGIAPTPEEQTEIIEFSGDPTKLADAESLLFHILRAVPSAFNRFNVMLFKINYGSEVSQQKGSLQTLESACNELRARGLFMKLLEAILKAGNRMNAGTARGNAQAFNLTALRKLSDVKSVDGKTTLLHFVVEEVVRSEGKRAAMSKISGCDIADASREEQEIEFIKLGLPIIGGLSSEFTNVKKAAGIDYDSFLATTLALGTRLKETKRLLDQSKGKEDGCLTKLRSFFESAEEELRVITEEQLRIMDLVKKTTNYYQAGGALKERNLFQLFVIIRDFLGMVDTACSEIARNQRKQRPAATVAGASPSTAATTPSAAAPQRNAVRFPILPPNFMSEHSRYSSSDSDSDS